MHIPSRRHRHVVALPLFLALAWLPFAGRTPPPAPLAAQVWQAADSERTVAIPGGRLLLAKGSTLIDEGGAARLDHGSALVAADGLLELTAGSWSVALWNGVAHVTVQGDALTLVGLTAPVLAEQHGIRMLVPAGLQWHGTPQDMQEDVWRRSDALLPLPEDFRLTQLSASLHLRRTPLTAVHPALPPLASLTPDLAADLLPRASQTDALRLLPVALSGARLWLLGSVHPALAGQAWVAALPADTTEDDRFLRLLQLPIADTQPQAMPQLSFERWREDLGALLYRSDDPPAFLQQVLDRLAQGLTSAREHALSERAARYAALIADLSETYGMLLDTPPVVSPSQASPLPRTLPAVAPISRAATAEEAAAARGLVTHLGGLLTSRTAVQIVDDAYRITGCVFATTQGDAVIDLTLTTDGAVLRDIVRNGRSYPNPVTPEQFAAWLRLP